MDLKILFLLILGITTSILLYKIVYHKLYGVEGFLKKFGKKIKKFGKKIKKVAKKAANPFESITSAIKWVTNTLNFILCFLEYVIKIFTWMSKTVIATFALFVPPCPIFHIIDIIIAFIAFILGSLSRLVGLDMLIDAFSAGRDGINNLTNAAFGVEITDYHKWMGIKSLCYNPKFAFQPFPKFIRPK